MESFSIWHYFMGMNAFRRFLIVSVWTASLLTGVSTAGALENSELVVAFSPTDLILDPVHSYKTQELQISTAIYEGLVTYHPLTLRPVAALAKRWEISDDGLKYRFFLRENGRYSNGDSVTAGDVRSSWLRVLNPEAEGEYSFLFDVIEGAYEYRKGTNSDPDSVGIRAADDLTLEVLLSQPAPHFLGMLCHMSFMPIHPQYYEEENWDRRPTIVGNGPYHIIRRSESEMLLGRNSNYWDKDNVELERIRIRFIDDPGQITRAFNDGEIHWAGTADTDTLTDPEAVQVSALFGTSYLYFNTGRSPWNDARVTRGLALLLPWDTIRQQQFSSFGTDVLVPRLEFYSGVEGIKEQNVREALELLAEAGYPEGEGLPEIRILVPSGSSAEETARRMASFWAETVSVKVDALEYGMYLRELERDSFTIATATWIGDFADPLTFLQLWTAESNLNDAHYRNSEYDGLIDKALSESEETRYGTLAEAENLLLGEAVVIPLSHPPAFNIVDLRLVSGWYANALDIHPFKQLGFKAGESTTRRYYASLDPEN